MHKILPSEPSSLSAPRAWHRRAIAALLLTGLMLLSACGGGRAPAATAAADAQRGPLMAPRSVVVDASHCQRPPSTMKSLLAYRMVEGECRRSFTGLDEQLTIGKARRQATAVAAATPRVPTATELFDWAEKAYPQYFPTHEADRHFGSFTYRFYPSALNHAATDGQRVYVQGPVSDGTLWEVGALADFACLVFPDSCGIVPRACSPVTNWASGSSVCAPNPGAGQTASGTTVTFVDTQGTLQGTATYRCNDGTLTLTQLPTCEAPPPLACDTSALSWNVGGKVCTPNPGQPTQLASGATMAFQSSLVNTGTAVYSCSNGALSPVGSPTCSTPVIAGCEPRVLTWSANGHTCISDTVLENIEIGGLFTFYDRTGLPTGYSSYTCFQQQLVPTGDQTCDPMVRVLDSFGNDGGGGDGTASGDGTAGDGKPIVGGRVRVVDAVGKVALATTNSQGYFRVNLTEFIAPMVVAVTRPDGVVRRSLVTRQPVPNQYIFIAVTGLTDKIASDVARASGASGAASLTPAMISAKPEAVLAAVQAMRNDPVLRELIVLAGLVPDTFDPLGTPFRTNGNGYDRVLDNVVVTVDSTGATVVKTMNCTVPASWSVGRDTCTPDPNEPTLIGNGNTLNVRDTLGATTGSASYSCSQGTVQMNGTPLCQSKGSASGQSR